MIIPPALVQSLTFLDGEQSDLDLRAHLAQLTGEIEVSGLRDHLIKTLSEAGFLEDETFERLKETAERTFRESPVRRALHAGNGYPAEVDELHSCLTGYMTPALDEQQPDLSPPTRAIAAPHVSPSGGIEAYRAAYRCLAPSDAERTFVILGTSHFGAPDTIGLTRKPFATPYGETLTDAALVDEISTGSNGVMEDYSHAIEHSIEFQVVYLQHLFGPRIKVIPILCGSFARSLYGGGLPEDHEDIRRIFGTLGEIAAREGDRLVWVLGVDMAHMGRRYGDRFDAHAEQGKMKQVAVRDFARIQCMEKGDAREFWELIQENHDDLKWCGSAPIYTFLRTAPDLRGRLIQYQQWNIDDASVVSFAGVRFF